MKYTGNYNLKKPEGSDTVNIDDLNDNFDVIDQALKNHEDDLATKETPAGAQAKANTAEANAKAYTDAHEQKCAHSGQKPCRLSGKANLPKQCESIYDAHEQKSAPIVDMKPVGQAKADRLKPMPKPCWI